MNTKVWKFFVWAIFVIAVLSTAAVIYSLSIDWTVRSLIAVICLLLVFSSISLAKTIRDDEEERKTQEKR